MNFAVTVGWVEPTGRADARPMTGSAKPIICQRLRLMGFAALYPSYIVERNPACAGEMAGPLSRTSIAAGQSNGLIGFICIPRYRIVRPEFIAASGS